MQTEEYDIAIVGGGIVGLSLAALLARLDLQILLIEAKSWPLISDVQSNEFDKRVSALNIAAEKLFTQIGVWEDVKNLRYCPYTDMHVWDADGTAFIDFSCHDLHQKALGYIVENNVLINSLLSNLKQFANVQLQDSTKVTAISDEIEKNKKSYRVIETNMKQKIKADLIVAADGANSQLRHMIQLPIKEWNTGQQAIVTTVETKKSHELTARQRFTKHGPLAFLPLLTHNGKQNYCSIVWSVMSDETDYLLQLDDNSFCNVLAQEFENNLGQIVSASQRHAYPLYQRFAKNYCQPNFVLVGDAAHTIHPLAGQGANLGLYDISVLADEINIGLQHENSIGSAVLLERYQRRRKLHNLAMLGAMEGFHQLFTQQNLPVRWLRNIGMRITDQITPVKKIIMRQAMGLDWNVPEL